MTKSFTIEMLLEFLDGDREVVERLEELGVIQRATGDRYSPEAAEHARVAHVLVRELEVNWAGVEVILKLRSELLETRRKLSEVAKLARGQRRQT